MRTYITIDGGTTSTRISLVKDNVVCDRVRLDIGARTSITERDKYVSSIKNAIDDIIDRNNANDVARILASGMITSEFGLCNLPHIVAPAGIGELHETMYETTIKEISDIPFVFVRGVKIESENLSECDMMRGEETELFGILNEKYGDCVYVLPGSHSKIIRTDAHNRIVSFSTMLTGEMMAALSHGTILKDAVDITTNSLNEKYLLMGYDLAQTEGINKALFKIRILKNCFGCTKEELYSFFMGVVLCDEISKIITDDAKTVVIGGRAQIKEATALILKEKSDKKVIELDETTVNNSTCVGAVRIFEYNS